MQKTNLLKKSILSLGILMGVIAFIPTTKAAPDWTNWVSGTPDNPAFIYNGEDPNRTGISIFAIAADDASNYTLNNLVSDNVNTPFLMDNNVGNEYNTLVNNQNVIFGYAWSERVGYINFSHGVAGFEPHFDTVGVNQVLKGYIWSENSGWIQLSGDAFDGIITNKTGWSTGNWGVRLNGNSFEGFAWGPGLGWIDFSKVTFDSVTGKFGGYACSDACSDTDKIYFAYSSDAPGNVQETRNELEAWGVSKNMTSVQDVFSNGADCELIGGTCIGGNAIFSTDANGETLSLNFANRLTLAGDHILNLKITNRFGQTYSALEKKFKATVWPANCSIVNGQLECDAPNVAITTDTLSAIADGKDEIKLTLALTDIPGGTPITTTDNITNINLTLNLNNRINRNQVSGLNNYDAVYYDTNELMPISNKLLGQSQTTIDLVDPDVNGNFVVDFKSLAPTFGVNVLTLDDFEIIMTLDADAPVPRALIFSTTNGDYNPIHHSFNFDPALISDISWDGALVENTPTKMTVSLTNNSPTESITEIDFNTIFDGIAAFLVADIKASANGGSTYSTPTQDQHILTNLANHLFSGLTYNGDRNIINSSIGAGITQSFDFVLTPELLLDDLIDLSKTINFNTQVAYKLPMSGNVTDGTDHTWHNTAWLDMANGAVRGQVEILGLSSGDHIYSIYSGSTLNNVGAMSFGDMSEEIRQNVADLTRNETGHPLPQTINTWEKMTRIHGDKVNYFRGNGSNKDLTIDNNGNDFIIPDNAGTILVVGGDIYIKSNLVYNSGAGSLGIIAMQDLAGNGGNIYIDPAVTNLVGGIYAEGSLMGAYDDNSNNKIDNTEIFDGFNGDKLKLSNQLLLNGTLISHNTIGGSRQNPIEFPEDVDQNCAGAGGGRDCAERYDLNYIRNFALNSSGAVINGGIRANGTAGVSDAPFVIEYDSRIQSNVPPAFEMSNAIDFREVVQ